MQMLSDLFWTALLVSGPILGATLVVGLLISILQVATQVQEMSLTFIPKLVTAALVVLAMGPWLLRQMASFSVRLWLAIPSML